MTKVSAAEFAANLDHYLNLVQDGPIEVIDDTGARVYAISPAAFEAFARDDVGALEVLATKSAPKEIKQAIAAEMDKKHTPPSKLLQGGAHDPAIHCSQDHNPSSRPLVLPPG